MAGLATFGRDILVIHTMIRDTLNSYIAPTKRQYADDLALGLNLRGSWTHILKGDDISV